MMCHDKNKVIFSHLVREGPIVFLVSRQCRLLNLKQIANLCREV